MSLHNRIRAIEEIAARQGSAQECRQQYRTIGPQSPEYDAVMLALIGCGAVRVTCPERDENATE
jgi:hypothetical protein